MKDARTTTARARNVLQRAFGLAQRRPVLTVFVVAIAVRLVAAVAIFVLRDGILFFDDGNYQRLTTAWLDGKLHEDPVAKAFWDENWAYLYPLAWAKRLLGGSTFGGQLLVVAIGATTAAVTTRLALEILAVRWALVAGSVVALLPSLVVWSSVSLKDPFVWLLVAGASLLFVLERKARSLRHRLGWFAASLAVLAVLEGVRAHSFIIVLLALVVGSLLVRTPDRAKRVAVAAGLAVLLPIIFGHGPLAIDILTQKPPEQQRALNAQAAETAVVTPVYHPESAPLRHQEAITGLQAVEAAILDLEARIAQPAATDTTTAAAPTSSTTFPPVAGIAELSSDPEEALAQLRARAAELRDAAATAESELESMPTGVWANIEYLPKGLGLMLLQPYLWSLSDNGSVRQAAMEHVLWYPLLVLALVGVAGLWSRREVLAVPVLAGGAALVVMALNEGNFGTAYRHRSEFVWVIAILAAVGCSVVERWWKSRAEGQSAAETVAGSSDVVEDEPFVHA